MVLVITVFWVLELQSAWNVVQWGALVPKAITGVFMPRYSTNNYIILVYRLNTYPLIHLGFLHSLLNTIALVPLMERFEAEHGTLLTGAMFLGRKLCVDTLSRRVTR